MNKTNNTENGLIIDKSVNCVNNSIKNGFKRECNACQSSDIENEHGLLVCTKCGQIYKDHNDSNQFRNDPTQEYTQNCTDFTPKLTQNLSNNTRYTYCSNRLPIAKKIGLKTVEELSSLFNLGTDMKSQAITKYSEISNHLIFNCTSKQTKIILAANCVYITLMNENRPVTIGHLCNAIACSNSEFGKVYSQVIKYFPHFKPESIPIESLVEVTLTEANFSSEEIKELEQRVIQIIDLERECWLIEGRSPFHIIFAATFLAWKSFKPYERRKVNLKQFCKQINIQYKHTTSERVTELFNAIKTLSSKIPGNKNLQITKTNISVHIEDILKYRNSLIYDLNIHMKQSKSHNTDDQNPNNKSIDWINAFKRKIPQNNQSNGLNPNYLTKDNLHLSEKSDEEISDSEIDTYIRGPKEVKIIKKLKRIVENEKETDLLNTN